MNTSFKFTLIGMVIFATTVISATSVAGDHHKERNGGPKMMKEIRKMFKGLDLSDDQMQQFKQIIETHKQTYKQNQQQRQLKKQTQRDDMLELLSNPSFDETQAELLIDKRQQTMQQKALAMMKLKHQLYQLLTPEQQQNLQSKLSAKDKIQELR